ncbi:hypothetical protein MMPV_007795 [Pyropia vietnamensis]
MAAIPTPQAVPFPSHGGIPPPHPTHLTDAEEHSDEGDDAKSGRRGGDDGGSTPSTPFFPPGSDAAAVLAVTAARATSAAPTGATALTPEAPPADEPLALYAADPVAYLARLAEELTLLEKADGDDSEGGGDGEGGREVTDDGGRGASGMEGRAGGNGVDEQVGAGGETARPNGDALLGWRDGGGGGGGGGDDSSSCGSGGSDHSWTVPPLPADLLTVESLLGPAPELQAPPLPPPPSLPSAPETAPTTATAAAVDPAAEFVAAVTTAGWTPTARPAVPFLPAGEDDGVGDLDWDALRLDPLDAAGLGDPDAVPSAGGSPVWAGDAPGVAAIPTATATTTATTLPTSPTTSTAAGPAVVAAVWSVTSTPPGALTFTVALPGVPSAAAVNVDVTSTDVTVGATTADGATRGGGGGGGVDAAFSAASGVLTLTLPLARGQEGDGECAAPQ